MDYFAEHGDDMISVKLIDLACIVARMGEIWADEGKISDSIIEERIFSCDLPRLEAYLPEEARREIAGML